MGLINSVTLFVVLFLSCWTMTSLYLYKSLHQSTTGPAATDAASSASRDQMFKNKKLHKTEKKEMAFDPQQRNNRKGHYFMKDRYPNEMFSGSEEARRHVEEKRVDYESFGEVHCPPEVPKGYPQEYPVMDVINNWPPDVVMRPEKIYRGLCYFNWETDQQIAVKYQEAEVPFVVRGHPDVEATAFRWKDTNYVDQFLQSKKYMTEYSENNHFMYWRGGKKSKEFKGWNPPTTMKSMKFNEWMDHAKAKGRPAEKIDRNEEHWYFRVSACSKKDKCPEPNTPELFDEMPWFDVKERTLLMVQPDQQRGIHCRFGMAGVIAENHFDGSRNTIALMSGERRYILSSQKNCKNMALYPKEHPSGRHSAVDWSEPDLSKFPEFEKVMVNEVVLQAGDVMYLPTNWFHYIISLDINFQCNSRSGITRESAKTMHECGF